MRNTPAIIMIVICLGIPFIISFFQDNESERRRFRRKTLLIGFIVMCIIVRFLPASILGKTEVSEASEQSNSDMEDKSESEHTSATVYTLSDVDLSELTQMECKSVSATSSLTNSNGYQYVVENAFDGNKDTCWQEGVEGNGEGTEIHASFSETGILQYIVIYNGQAKTEEKFKKNGRVRQLEISTDKYTDTIELPDENIPVAVKLDGWENVTDICFKINSVYPGSSYSDTCITDILFYR